MSIRSERGIVLSRKQLGESDIKATILTERSGSGSYIFKGLKKTRKRQLSGALPGSMIIFSAYTNEKKRLSYIHSFEVSAYPLGNLHFFQQSTVAYFLLELCDKTSPPAMPLPFVFTLLERALTRVAQSNSPLQLALVFLLHILKHHGILPDRELLLESMHSISTHFTITTEQNEYLVEALHVHFSKLDSNKITSDEILDLLYMFTMYIENYFHIELLSKKVLFTSHNNST